MFTVWDSLPENERVFYKAFLASLGYDSDDEFLAVNEFQAYLMQQPLEYAASFFKRFRSGIDANRLTASAKELDTFLQSTFGLRAGETLTP